MNLEKLVVTLTDDPPFSYPHPNERTRSLLVETSSVKLYKQELGIRVRDFMHNSGLTAIVGRARSGKTHFIYNLDYTTNVEGKWKGIIVYLPLAGKDIEYEDLVRSIVENEHFQKRARDVGIDPSSDPSSHGVLLVIDALQGLYGKETGIILAVDNLDEHFRQREVRARKRGMSPDEDIEGFLGLFRILIGEGGIDRGLCVLFSLTEAARDKLREFLSDPTLAERFDFIHDPTNPGQDLRLSELSEDEATLIVSQYMAHWAGRNDITLPELSESTVDGNNTFPFTGSAIRLFWRAGSFAGHICKGCKSAIVRKCSHGSVNKIEDLIVSERDAAYVVSASAGMFPTFPQVTTEIAVLIGGSQIEEDVRSWVETVASVKFAGELRKAEFPIAFKEYLETIGEESDLRVEQEVAVIDPHTNQPSSIHLRVHLEDVPIGIVFTRGPVADVDQGKPMVIALKGGAIKSGIFTYAGKPPGYGADGRRERGIGLDLSAELRDWATTRDFNTTVRWVPIDDLSAWGLVRSREFTDPVQRLLVYSWVESRIQFLGALEGMLAVEPRRLQSRGYRPGDLDRGGA